MKKTTNKKVKWYNFFSRGNHPLIVTDLHWRSRVFYHSFLLLPPFSAYARDQSTYLDQVEYKKIIHILKKQLVQKPKLVIKILKNKAIPVYSSFNSFIYRYKNNNWDNFSLIAAREICLKFYDHLSRTFVFTYWPIWLDGITVDLLKPRLNKIWGREWYKVYYNLTRPKKLTSKDYFQRSLERQAYLFYKKRITKADLKVVSKRLAERYGYLRNYLFKIQPYTTEQIIQEIIYLSKQLTSQEEIEKDIGYNLSCLSKRERDICNLMSQVVYLREQRIIWWNRGIFYMFPLFKRLARLLGITYGEFIQLSYDELKSGSFSRIELKQRIKGYRFEGIDDKVKIYYSKVGAVKKGKGDIIQGISAKPGKVRGRVQVCDPYSLSRIKRGVILVTPMTTPEAVAFIRSRKVKAIITDEGGVTAHAAILARELKIPCIVGTKIATKVLRDGDLVEVDAEGGVVKKI